MTTENFHLTIDTGIVKTQDHSDSPTNADMHLRAQTLPAHIKLHSIHSTHIQRHEVSANALAQKLNALKTSEEATTTATADKNQDPENQQQQQQQQPPLLLDRAALITIELQQRGEEALQDILGRLESKKGALTEVTETETVESSLDSNETFVRRQHAYKINPELLKDNHPLQQHHGNANLRHH